MNLSVNSFLIFYFLLSNCLASPILLSLQQNEQPLPQHIYDDISTPSETSSLDDSFERLYRRDEPRSPIPNPPSGQRYRCKPPSILGTAEACAQYCDGVYMYIERNLFSKHNTTKFCNEKGGHYNPTFFANHIHYLSWCFSCNQYYQVESGQTLRAALGGCIGSISYSPNIPMCEDKCIKPEHVVSNQCNQARNNIRNMVNSLESLDVNLPDYSYRHCYEFTHNFQWISMLKLCNEEPDLIARVDVAAEKCDYFNPKEYIETCIETTTTTTTTSETDVSESSQESTITGSSDESFLPSTDSNPSISKTTTSLSSEPTNSQSKVNTSTEGTETSESQSDGTITSSVDTTGSVDPSNSSDSLSGISSTSSVISSDTSGSQSPSISSSETTKSISDSSMLTSYTDESTATTSATSSSPTFVKTIAAPTGNQFYNCIPYGTLDTADDCSTWCAGVNEALYRDILQFTKPYSLCVHPDDANSTSPQPGEYYEYEKAKYHFPRIKLCLQCSETYPNEHEVKLKESLANCSEMPSKDTKVEACEDVCIKREAITDQYCEENYDFTSQRIDDLMNVPPTTNNYNFFVCRRIFSQWARLSALNICEKFDEELMSKFETALSKCSLFNQEFKLMEACEPVSLPTTVTSVGTSHSTATDDTTHSMPSISELSSATTTSATGSSSPFKNSIPAPTRGQTVRCIPHGTLDDSSSCSSFCSGVVRALELNVLFAHSISHLCVRPDEANSTTPQPGEYYDYGMTRVQFTYMKMCQQCSDTYPNEYRSRLDNLLADCSEKPYEINEIYACEDICIRPETITDQYCEENYDFISQEVEKWLNTPPTTGNYNYFMCRRIFGHWARVSLLNICGNFDDELMSKFKTALSKCNQFDEEVKLMVACDPVSSSISVTSVETSSTESHSDGELTGSSQETASASDSSSSEYGSSITSTVDSKDVSDTGSVSPTNIPGSQSVTGTANPSNSFGSLSDGVSSSSINPTNSSGTHSANSTETPSTSTNVEPSETFSISDSSHSTTKSATTTPATGSSSPFKNSIPAPTRGQTVRCIPHGTLDDSSSCSSFCSGVVRALELNVLFAHSISHLCVRPDEANSTTPQPGEYYDYAKTRIQFKYMKMCQQCSETYPNEFNARLNSLLADCSKKPYENNEIYACEDICVRPETITDQYCEENYEFISQEIEKWLNTPPTTGNYNYFMCRRIFDQWARVSLLNMCGKFDDTLMSKFKTALSKCNQFDEEVKLMVACDPVSSSVTVTSVESSSTSGGSITGTIDSTDVPGTGSINPTNSPGSQSYGTSTSSFHPTDASNIQSFDSTENSLTSTSIGSSKEFSGSHASDFTTIADEATRSSHQNSTPTTRIDEETTQGSDFGTTRTTDENGSILPQSKKSSSEGSTQGSGQIGPQPNPTQADNDGGQILPQPNPTQSGNGDGQTLPKSNESQPVNDSNGSNGSNGPDGSNDNSGQVLPQPNGSQSGGNSNGSNGSNGFGGSNENNGQILPQSNESQSENDSSDSTKENNGSNGSNDSDSDGSNGFNSLNGSNGSGGSNEDNGQILPGPNESQHGDASSDYTKENNGQPGSDQDPENGQIAPNQDTANPNDSNNNDGSNQGDILTDLNQQNNGDLTNTKPDQQNDQKSSQKSSNGDGNGGSNIKSGDKDFANSESNKSGSGSENLANSQNGDLASHNNAEGATNPNSQAGLGSSSSSQNGQSGNNVKDSNNSSSNGNNLGASSNGNGSSSSDMGRTDGSQQLESDNNGLSGEGDSVNGMNQQPPDLLQIAGTGDNTEQDMLEQVNGAIALSDNSILSLFIFMGMAIIFI